MIDCAVHHAWSDDADLMCYLSPSWREYFGYPNNLPGKHGTVPALPRRPYQSPLGDKMQDSWPEIGPPGSDLELLRTQHLERHAIGVALLCYDHARLIPAHPNPRLSAALCSAANDWTIERWLAVDDRLRGALLVPNQIPEAAVSEIQRSARRSGVSAVLMCGNGLGKPFGHPAYLPIFEPPLTTDSPLSFTLGAMLPTIH